MFLQADKLQKYSRFILIVILILLGLLTIQPTAYNNPAEEQAKYEIHQTFEQWLYAVGSGDAEKVTKLYAEEAILLPTHHPDLHDTPGLRKDYFEKFTARPEMRGSIKEENIRIFGNVAVNSGIYFFSFKEGGKIIEVPARYSFVYQKTKNGWIIVDHHSSKLPDKA